MEAGMIDIPKDLRDFLLKYAYPKRYGAAKTSIEKEHKSAMMWIDSSKNNKNKQLVNQKDLIGIYNYINGDVAFYSTKDSKIYDFQHSTDKFTKSFPYKKWIIDIKKGKVDTWS